MIIQIAILKNDRITKCPLKNYLLYQLTGGSSDPSCKF